MLAVCLTAYLAAFFLVRDADRLSDEAMVAYFRRRATGAGVAAGVVALVGIFVLANDAEYLFDGLTSRALPLVILSAICGLGALLLVTRGVRRGARLAAVGAVVGVLLAWGVAQWDYLLPESLTVSAAAAPSGTITAVLVATGTRSGPDRARLRPALRARPEEPPARGGHARAPHVWDARRLSDEVMVAYFRRRAAVPQWPPVSCRSRASSCCPTTPTTSSTGSPRGPCPW